MTNRPIIAGNHIYQRCEVCGKLVRMTGLFAGLHFCLTDEEIAKARDELKDNDARQ